MSKPTLILIIILFLFTGGLLILALNKSLYKPAQIIQPPTPSTKPVLPETSLLFGNLEIASSSGKPKTYSLPIIINTGTNKVTAVQLELSFDPNILTNVSIWSSDFFKNPNVVINKTNTDTGRIYYALSASNAAAAESDSAAAKTASESASPAHATERGKQGDGTLAVLTFESRVPLVPSTITFLPRTFVTAEGLDSSALKSTNSAELKFGN